MMWDSLKMPFEEKVKYVSNPKNHSLHNYGCAIDLTLLDSFGRVLDMGTEFDHFGIEANTDKDSINMANGKLTKAQIRNRWLLRKCMYKAGFSGIKSEWWHFNSCSREVAKKRYKLIE